jgi:prepilin-type N-terminal cleavage/methylation domain-containing protein
MRFKSLNNHGYTLIEIIMVIVILGVIGGFTFQMVAAGVQAFKKSSARKELYDQGRLALERMVRELRDAKEVEGSSTSSITFRKAHPDQAADYLEEIKFQLNGSNLERVGNPSGAPVTAVLASDVSGFTVAGVTSGGESGTCTIASDSQSSAYAGDATSLTFSHTIGGGSDRVLVVGVSIETCGPYATVSSITYGGKSLSYLNSAQVTSSNDCRGRVELYYLLEANMPGAGPFNVVVTATGSCDALAAGAISLTGVAQQAPEASNTHANDAQTSISTSITTLTNGAWLVDAVHSGNPNTFTANSGQSVRYDRPTSTSEIAGGTLLVTTAGNVSLGWSNSGANRLAQAVAAFAPATGCLTGGTGNLVMVTGDGAYSSGVDDGAKKTLFEGWGWTVTAIDDGAGQTTYNNAATDNDVMFISESVTSGNVNTKALGLDIGVVVEEEALSDDMQFTSTYSTSSGNATQIYVNDNSYYITNPFSTGNLTIYSTSDLVYRISTALGSGAQVLAQQAGGGNPCLFVFDTGAQLASSTAVNRRVGFHFIHTSNPAHWNSNLQTLLRRSLEWASGIETGHLVTLELTLSSEQGGTVSMRTKVFLRNMP